jgi:hypothetical protein
VSDDALEHLAFERGERLAVETRELDRKDGGFAQPVELDT